MIKLPEIAGYSEAVTAPHAPPGKGLLGLERRLPKHAFVPAVLCLLGAEGNPKVPTLIVRSQGLSTQSGQ